MSNDRKPYNTPELKEWDAKKFQELSDEQADDLVQLLFAMKKIPSDRRFDALVWLAKVLIEKGPSYIDDFNKK